jgi:putative oxidoreductase
MLVHGAQKVLGVMGGKGFDLWLQGTPPFGFMKPAALWLGAAALAEFLGGILVLLGLLTRPAAFFIACTMATAVFGVHWQNGFLGANGGYEFPLVLLLAAISLIMSGAGNGSVDQKLS